MAKKKDKVDVIETGSGVVADVSTNEVVADVSGSLTGTVVDTIISDDILPVEDVAVSTDTADILSNAMLNAKKQRRLMYEARERMRNITVVDGNIVIG